MRTTFLQAWITEVRVSEGQELAGLVRVSWVWQSSWIPTCGAAALPISTPPGDLSGAVLKKPHAARQELIVANYTL